jgi:hypothetical protein
MDLERRSRRERVMGDSAGKGRAGAVATTRRQSPEPDGKGYFKKQFPYRGFSENNRITIMKRDPL